MTTTHSCFFYGTLMSPKVISRVLDQGLLEGEESYVVKYQVAVLPNYKRCALHHAPYPAITRDWDSQVVGVLVTDLTDRQLALLDLYEGQEYDRQMVPIMVGSKEVPGWAYVWGSGSKLLNLEEDWREEEWIESSNVDAFLREEIQEMRRQIVKEE